MNNPVYKTELGFSTESGEHYDVFIKAQLTGTDKSFHGGKMCYTYKVTISADGKTCSFTFHTSINDFNNKKTEMTRADLQNAFHCFLLDAVSGDMDYIDFCEEFGYENGAKDTYNACVKAKEKAERLFSDIYEVSNTISELVNA